MAVSPQTRASLLLLLALALLLAGTVIAVSPARSEPAPARAGTLIQYAGAQGKARLPLEASRLPGAPPAFRSFVKHTLHRMWDQLGHTAGCKSSPLITVRAVRTDGFALGDVNTLPRPHCETGGGYEAIWAVRHGQWKEVIGTQEVVDCATLERYAIPSEIGVHQCYQGTKVVPYDHA